MTRPVQRPMGGGPGARMLGGPMPTEKLQDFKGSTKRLLGLMKPQRLLVGFILLFGVVSVFLSVLGPWLLGKGTDIIFAGVLGKSVRRIAPAGATKAQVVAALRAQGNGKLANLASDVDFTPGQGIDFVKLGH